MFSLAELDLIKQWGEEFKDILQAHLSSPVFSDGEKYMKKKEIEVIDDIVSTIDEAARIYVSLDADRIGELFTVLRDFKEYMEHQAMDGNVACLDYGETMCRIGYLQAKIDAGGLLTNAEYEEILGILDTLDE